MLVDVGLCRKCLYLGFVWVELGRTVLVCELLGSAYLVFDKMCKRKLCQLTESWMEQLMDRMVAKGQTVDDLLRRSTEIPAAFSTFFLSEPEGAPKKLLPRALRWLIDVARKPLLDEEVEPYG
ncbi:hypothetical protein Drorol1_Dr00000555 [Drosera rotundifolia]